MKRVLKQLGRRLIGPVAHRLGFRIPTKVIKKNADDKQKLLDTLFTNLVSIDFVPQHIIDVGANHGTWTRKAMKFFPDSNYTLLEPQKWLSGSSDDLAKLSNVNINWVGAGKKEGSFTFTIHDRDDSSTFRLSEEEALKRGFKQIEVPVVTLNKIVKESSFLNPDIVKIDAEGMDLEVLHGASDLFSQTEVFMVEAGVVHHKFTNDIRSVINYMHEKGYRLFEITDLNRPFTKKVLWLVELVFVKKGGYIDSFNYQ